MRRILSFALLTSVIAAAQTTPMRGIHTHYEWKPYTSKAQWEPRRAELQQRILTAAGLDPMPPKTAIHARYVKQTQTSMAVIHTLLLETLPGFFVGANLYKPLKAPAAKMPAVLVPHGHWPNGRVENIPLYSMPALAMNLARQGYVVLTVDMVGYNDTDQLPHRFQSAEMDLWSYTPLGLQLWNGIRALDFLSSMKEVDANRLAVTGASGGGTQTFLLAAVDDRVKVAAPVNMISASMQGGCVCEGAPGLRVDTFNVELAAIVAPRPMLMVSCTGDWTRNTPNQEFPLMRKMYDLYGSDARVENVHIQAEHNYNRESREAVYRFLAKHLRPDLDDAELSEQRIDPFNPADLLSGGAAQKKKTAAELFTAWQTMSQEQTRTSGTAELRERLRRVFHLDHISSRPLQTSWRPGKGSPRLIIQSGPAEVPPDLLNLERPVMVLRVDRYTDPAAVAAAQSYHTYNLADGVLQVQDILRAIQSIPGDESVEVVTLLDEMLPAALYASALSARNARLGAKDALAKAGKQPFFVPGIQRAGGTLAALRVGR
ncbi:MAG TPA: acetylxylan esterase [Bryobacteraceae bacterium]|nr:acetylxylan esterase [Bryobacteraceae bacterium]